MWDVGGQLCTQVCKQTPLQRCCVVCCLLLLRGCFTDKEACFPRMPSLVSGKDLGRVKHLLGFIILFLVCRGGQSRGQTTVCYRLLSAGRLRDHLMIIVTPLHSFVILVVGGSDDRREMEAARRMERIGSHVSASAMGPRAGTRDCPDDIVIVDAIRTPITRAKKVHVQQFMWTSFALQQQYQYELLLQSALPCRAACALGAYSIYHRLRSL